MNIIASNPLVVAALTVCVLVVVVVAVVGLARGQGVRPALWAVLAMSICAIGVITLGSVVTRQLVGEPGVNVVPFQEIQRGLNNRGTSSWTNVVGNVAMFVPFGFVIACLARGGLWGRLILATVSGLVFSAAIEVTQYSFGRVADIDDVILNTSGALVGGLVGALVAVLVTRAQQRRG